MGREKSPLTVGRLSGRAGLEAVAPEWARLASELAPSRFFHTVEWHASYLDALAEEPDAVVFHVVRDGGELVAIVPLEGMPAGLLSAPARGLGLPRHKHLALADLVCRPGVSAEAVIRAVTGSLREARTPWDVLAFGKVLDESSLSGLAASRWRVQARATACARLSCERPIEEVVRGLPGKSRQNLTNARNRLNREADARFESIREGPALERALPEFLDLEASGWKGESGTRSAIRLQPRLVRFYTLLVERLSPQGRVVLHGLRVGGALIAAQLCLRDADTLHAYKVAYHQGHARLSPGHLLLHYTLQTAHREGLRYLGAVGDPSWLKPWRPERTPLREILVFNHTLRGRGHWALEQARRGLSGALGRMRTRAPTSREPG